MAYPGGVTVADAPPLALGNLTPREVIKITHFHLKTWAVLQIKYHDKHRYRRNAFLNLYCTLNMV